MPLNNGPAMKETALYFSSIDEICSFLRETNRRNFVLFGKKSILLASFSAEEIALAQNEYGAIVTEIPEKIRNNQKVLSGF
jgi:hypothetical protein